MPAASFIPGLFSSISHYIATPLFSFFFFFVVLEFEFRAYTSSHSTSPFSL
jgi:hypothetical protein